MQTENQLRARIEALEQHCFELQDVVNTNAVCLTACLQLLVEKEIISNREFNEARIRQTACADQIIAKKIEQKINDRNRKTL